MRYYYKDEKGNFYSLTEEQEDLIPITEEEWNEHNKSLEFVQEDVEIIQRYNQIEELKFLLYSTDYQAIKYAEGEISEEDYAPIKAQRRAWREEINRLESVQ